MELARDCELRLVISLPRVFKNNNARMAIIYLVRNPQPTSTKKVLVAEVHEKWRNAEGKEVITDLFGELESIVDDCV